MPINSLAKCLYYMFKESMFLSMLKMYKAEDIVTIINKQSAKTYLQSGTFFLTSAYMLEIMPLSVISFYDSEFTSIKVQV